MWPIEKQGNGMTQVFLISLQLPSPSSVDLSNKNTTSPQKEENTEH